MTDRLTALRRRAAGWLDDRPRIQRYYRLDGTWFAVDDEGNVWTQAWCSTVIRPPFDNTGEAPAKVVFPTQEATQ